MLRIYNSENLYDLADECLQELHRHPPKNPLAPEQFVVQNHGMARWLSRYLAAKEGITANLNFNFPAELFWKIARTMDSSIPEMLPAERWPMTWTIYEVLYRDNDPALTVLHQYINQRDSQNAAMRRWELACRISDVFDQYLTYRPKMIRSWEKNKLVTNENMERWQAILWNKLNDHWSIKNGEEVHHRARLQKNLFQAIKEKSIPAEKLPSRVIIFGVTEMPPVYLQLGMELAKLTNVHFYLPDCSAHKKNTLVRSLGRAGREFYELTESFLTGENKLKKLQTNDGEQLTEDRSNFFEVLKRDLRLDAGKKNQATPDGSFQVHSCHSPRREVEVLYDQLLNILEENEDLEPEDIHILTPQFDIYAPEIKAIFGAVEEGMPQIPFHLAEAPHASPVMESFRKLIDLVDSRLKVTDVLDLLNSQPIRSAFSLSDENINTLEKWVEENRIRWGIDGGQKASLGLPESDSYTWQSGLQRLLSGYAMEPDEERLFKGIYPYSNIRQSEDSQLLGQFSRFLHQLFRCHRQANERRTIEEWGRILGNWLSIFFTDEEPWFAQIQWLRDKINVLVDETKNARFAEKVPYQIICNYFEKMIDENSKGGGRPGPGVTFSSMISMRNIPAKVIGLVGMDDGSFPRSRNVPGFDLINKLPQKGDRSPASNDRQIFLECLMGASSGFYVSYVGQSDRSDVEFPPSVVVRELIDYIVETYNIRQDEIVQYHPLQAFSMRYFNKNRDYLFSFSQKNCNIARRLSQAHSEIPALIDNKLPEPDDSFKNITIEELVAFFQHPSKYLLQQRLGVYLQDDSVLDQDQESFKL
ncbi:MAG TPA: exodeoxyribonuclease V subunit gamma, partial [Balneolaceae bacterium]|nr:exodeoxyribonuclease V subunit gamma [Balneolaceae bacterium]